MDLSDFRLKLAIVQDLEEGNVFVTANPVEVKLEKKVCLPTCGASVPAANREVSAAPAIAPRAPQTYPLLNHGPQHSGPHLGQVAAIANI